MIKNIEDLRAINDVGSALLIKKSSGKYSLFLPLTNIPATGGSPDQIEVTVTTARGKTYIEGRKDNPQKELTFYAHRDNFMKIKEAKSRGLCEFLQINPDNSAWAYKGTIVYYQDATSVNNPISGKVVITVKSAEEDVRDNATDLIEDIVTFTGAVPDTVTLTGTDTEEILIETDPADATITATSDTESVATASYEDGKVVITAVAPGSCLVRIDATAEGCASNFTTVLVIVE